MLIAGYRVGTPGQDECSGIGTVVGQVRSGLGYQARACVVAGIDGGEDVVIDERAAAVAVEGAERNVEGGIRKAAC